MGQLWSIPGPQTLKLTLMLIRNGTKRYVKRKKKKNWSYYKDLEKLESNRHSNCREHINEDIKMFIKLGH